MKESIWGYWVALFGIIVIIVMIMFQNYTTTNEQDYYLAREITYAALNDSIDYGYYKKHGELKIIKEKFVENFIRRFSENTTINRTYKVNFYSIHEIPPSVSLEIETISGDYKTETDQLDARIVTRITAILEEK